MGKSIRLCRSYYKRGSTEKSCLLSTVVTTISTIINIAAIVAQIITLAIINSITVIVIVIVIVIVTAIAITYSIGLTIITERIGKSLAIIADYKLCSSSIIDFNESIA